jgi:hypothetical protein
MNQKYLVAETRGMKRDKAACLKADAINIASFLVKNRLAPFISIDTLDECPLLTARYGFIDKCYDQDFLIHQLLPVLVPMQLGETKAQKLETVTSVNELPADVDRRPDWNYMKDYGITDEEYAAMGKHDADEDEDMER